MQTGLNKNRWVLIVIVVVFSAVILNSLWDDSKSRSRLDKIGIAVVIDINALKGGNDVVYEFWVNKKKYHNSTLFSGMCVKLVRTVRYKSFPILYEKDNPENSRILIDEKSFARFNMAIPDSLRWVQKYCE